MNNNVLWQTKETSGKIYFTYTDASSDVDFRISSGAFVVEDYNGSIIDKASFPLLFAENIAVCEAQALLLCLTFCKENHYNRVYCHIDCTSLHQTIFKPTGKEPKNLRDQVKKIRRIAKQFMEVRIILTDRELLTVCHRLSINKLRNTRKVLNAI